MWSHSTKVCGVRRHCGGRQVARNWNRSHWHHGPHDDAKTCSTYSNQLTPKIQELTHALEEEVEKRPVARRLRTHPGVGPLTALAFELVIGTPERFHCGKQIASYVGLVPSEESSGDRRRLGHISKQGNALLRFLLVEAAQVTVRSEPQWRSKFFHLAMRRGRKIAKVAMARKLAVHLYWMWRQGCEYGQFEKLGSHAGEPGNRHGAQ